MTRGALFWVFYLVLSITSFPLVTPQSSSLCNRTCHAASLSHEVVPYPFGFSESCEIPLNCTNGNMHIGDFQVHNITEDSFTAIVPAKCDRPVRDLMPLFGQNYAPKLENGLLLQNCTTPPVDCLIPMTLDDQGCDQPRCFSRTGDGFMDFAEVGRTSCKFVYCSIVIQGTNNGSGLLMEFEAARLGWWLDGECKCSENARCVTVVIPYTGQPGFRCQCEHGFIGDGFLAGSGCRKDGGNDSPEKKDSGNAAKASVRTKIAIAIPIAALGIIVAALISIYFLMVKEERPLLPWKKKSETRLNFEALLKNHSAHLPKRYKFKEVRRMTNSFKDKLGQGGYGSVFKGTVNAHDGMSLVAVKVLSETKGDGEEFINEVASISRTSHVNIVTLVGYCFEGSKRALLYEYMPNGSLEKYIHGDKRLESYSSSLGWETLYRIAIGIARGLEYLHRGCNTRILHFDIKPHNILLDQEFCPKISDFGLAKLCPNKESIISMLGGRGTAGYIAPEVFSRNFGGVSHKSDVYSYGMMILEMVGGRKNFDVGVDHTSEIYYPDWIHNRIELDEEELGLHEVDSEAQRERAKKMILVGLWCIQTNPVDRPSMSDVLEMFHGSLDVLLTPPKPYLSSPSRDAGESS